MQTRQEEKLLNTNRHYSLRKLSVGLASVLIGLSFASATKIQTVKADSLNQSSAYLRENENTVRNETQQFSSVQNSVAEPQKNLLENTENNQTEAKNQENRLADQSNNKLINQDSTNSNQDSGQNLTDPNEAKQDAVTKKDVTSDIVHTRSSQEFNNHAENNSQTQTSQKPDLTKNSRKFSRKVLATNLIETTSSPMTNGGFDEATWGKFDINNWHGSVQDGVYQLTGYTGDEIHIIVPNEADFEQAGRSTNGLQVGITRDTVQSLLTHYGSNYTPKTIAFSKTNDQKVKAIGTDWSHAFSKSAITNFDGSNLDVSGVTNMSNMFGDMFLSNEINDLSSLANWDTSKVTNMSNMFIKNKISDLTPLTNWDVSSVTNMSYMFFGNSISDLSPLTHWDTSKVTDMNSMFGGGFYHNSISDLAPLANWNVSKVTDMGGMLWNNKVSDLTSLAHWDTSKVIDMNRMFADNSISNLTPLTHWDTSKVTDMNRMFEHNQISDLAPLTHWDTSNVTDMSSMFEHNQISNLASLTNWNVSNVTDMSSMFEHNQINNLTPLKNWDTSKVTDMSSMFAVNQISDLTPLTNWDTNKVTYMSHMFAQNPDIKDLKPVANRDVRSVAIKYLTGIFSGDTQLDLTDINNTQFMQDFVKLKEKAKDTSYTSYTSALRHILGNVLQGTTFITNNADLVEVVVGQDLPTFTKTAKRTIVFHFPNGTQKEIDQIINFKTIAPVQIEWPAPTYDMIKARVLAFASERPPFASFASVRQPVQSDGPRIIKTYPVKESDWQLDTSKPNDDVIIDGVICFKPVQIPRIDGYKAYLMKDPVNPAMFLVSFVALPQQLQNNQSNNVQLPQKQPEQKQPEQKQPEQKQPEQKQSEQKQPEQKQPEQKQPEQKQPEQKQSEQKRPEQKQSEQKQSEQKPAQPIQTRSADAKQVDQIIDHISYVLMHNDSTFDNVNSFEPVQDDSASLEASSDSTQKDDAAKIVNVAKPKKHIVKKHVVKRHKKHAKKYHLKRRSRKRSRHAKKRVKHRKSVLRKFRKYNLKHVKKA